LDAGNSNEAKVGLCVGREVGLSVGALTGLFVGADVVGIEYSSKHIVIIGYWEL